MFKEWCRVIENWNFNLPHSLGWVDQASLEVCIGRSGIWGDGFHGRKLFLDTKVFSKFLGWQVEVRRVSPNIQNWLFNMLSSQAMNWKFILRKDPTQ
jgi:hypothetical protein